MPKLWKSDVPSEPAIRALILYDDPVLAAQVNATLQRAVSRMDVAVLWDIKTWRVDAFKKRSLADEAMQETIGAYLIVFAGNFGRSLSVCLYDWLERWAAQRQINDVALAVVGNYNLDLISSSVTPDLTKFAQMHGLNFIAYENISGENGPDFFARSLLGRKRSVFLPGNRESKIHNSPIRWGINE